MLKVSDFKPSKKELRNLFITLNRWSERDISPNEKGEGAVVYILTVVSDTFICYKIGYSANFEYRLASLKKRNPDVTFTLLKLFRFKFKLTALVVEQKLLALTKDKRPNYKINDGHTELRTSNIFKTNLELLDIMEELKNVNYLDKYSHLPK